MAGYSFDRRKSEVEEIVAKCRDFLLGLPKSDAMLAGLGLGRAYDQFGCVLEAIRCLRKARRELRLGLRSVSSLRDDELTAQQQATKKREIARATAEISMVSGGIREIEQLIRSRTISPGESSSN